MYVGLHVILKELDVHFKKIVLIRKVVVNLICACADPLSSVMIVVSTLIFQDEDELLQNLMSVLFHTRHSSKLSAYSTQP